MEWVDSGGKFLSKSGKLGGDDLRSGKGNLGFPLTSAPLHYTENVRDVGGFDPRLPRAQEFDLHIRMWFAGTDFFYQPGITYYYQQHEGVRVSSGDGLADTYEARLAAYSRYLESAAAMTDSTVAKKVRRYLAVAIWSLGRLAVRNGVHGPVVDECFTKATEIAGRNAVTGSTTYQLATLAFGPKLSESLLSKLKRLL